jgi:hypothetical protein
LDSITTLTHPKYRQFEAASAEAGERWLYRFPIDVFTGH